MTKIIKQIHEKNPIVLHLANRVTTQRVADATNYVGGSPIMIADISEAHDLINNVNSLSLNLGSTTNNSHELALALGKAANEKAIPIILDPVAVGASNIRLQRVNELLSSFKVNLVRGNLGEIATLSGIKWNSKGIDAGNGDGNAVSIAKKAAKKLGCIVVVSGSTDIITDANETFLIHNNAPMLCTNVGMGDVLDAILSVFLSYNDSVKDIAYATAILPIAAEQATKEYTDQPASFCVKTFDNLYKMTDLTLEKYIKMVKI